MLVTWQEPYMIDDKKTCLINSDADGFIYTGTIAGVFSKPVLHVFTTMFLVAMSDGTFYEVPASKCTWN